MSHSQSQEGQVMRHGGWVRIEVWLSGLTVCKSGLVGTLLTTTLSGLYIQVVTIMRGNEEYHKERDPWARGEPCGMDK